MCEVVKSNFEQLLPQIEEVISRSHFIVLDAEFSGLNVSDKSRGSLFDTGEQRYRKLRSSVQAFTLVQIGISAFERDEYENMYKATSYNIYLQPAICGSIDVRYLSQASSLQFLSQYNFDFNKFVYEGVPYMNEEQEQMLRHSFSDHLVSVTNDFGATTDEMQECYKSVGDWVSNAEEGATVTLNTSTDRLNFAALLDLRLRYPQTWTDIVDDKVVVTKVSVQTRAQLEDEFRVHGEERMLGFTKVFRLLRKLKKPLIGHNNFTDLLYLYDKFYRPLPESYEKFKEDIHEMFPVIIDTKHLSTIMRLSHKESGLFCSTGLSQLYEALSGEKARSYTIYTPSILHDERSKGYGKSHCPHEAGYDAFMCGYVFLRMVHIMAAAEIKSYQDVRPLSFTEYMTAAKPYVNVINLIRAGIPSMNLTGKDKEFEHIEWLYIYARKGNLYLRDLVEVLNEFGSVDIYCRSRRAAILAVKGRNCAKDLMKAFKSNRAITVTRYSVLRHHPTVRKALWVGAVISGMACVGVLWTFVKNKS